jgi:hypothetical protein
MSQLFSEWTSTMRDGDYERAWALAAQQREAAKQSGQRPDDPRLPYHMRWVWDGREVDGRNVIVRCYHGLGDTIQFLRFLPELHRRADGVTLEIQPRLMPLLGDSVRAFAVPFDERKPLAPSGCDIEIMELSMALRAKPSFFPPPYLRRRPAPLVPRTLAICSTAGEWDASRSIAPELIAPICEDRPCITLDPAPSPLPVANPGGCPLDIVQTTALITRASLVVTVDTMVAHLAGALNRPTWLLLKHEPDWRWAPNRGESDWYPSMRFYVQPRPGDWRSVVAAVRRDLDSVLPRRSQAYEREPSVSPSARFVGRTARQDRHTPDQA